ncbi:helix-turn-helix domain-containing protein [Luteimonas pelagia]
MKIGHGMDDAAILAELGARLAGLRLACDRTQADVAAEAGISKRTLERLEGGASTQTVNLVRVLRALDALGGLETALPPAGPGPMQLLRGGGRPRRRASGDASAGSGRAPWRWDAGQ